VIGRGNPVVLVDVNPPSTNVPLVNRKRDHPTKAVQSNVEVESSFRQPLMLNPLLRVVQDVQIGLLPEDESVLAAGPTNALILELVEIKSRALVVGRMLGKELEMTTTMVVPKLKTELAEFASSLKASLDAMEAFKKEGRQESMVAKKAQQALKVEIEAIKTELAKEKAEAEEREKTLSMKVETC